MFVSALGFVVIAAPPSKVEVPVRHLRASRIVASINFPAAPNYLPATGESVGYGRSLLGPNVSICFDDLRGVVILYGGTDADREAGARVVQLFDVEPQHIRAAITIV